MMEYQTIVKVGRNSVKVNFSGGSISNGCMQPARFSTKNLIIQNAIEASDEFMKGRIRLEKAIPLNEEIRVEKPETPTPGTSESRPQHNEEADGTETQGEPEAPTPRQTETSATSTDEAEGPDNGSSGLMEVEVSCKDVAKQYLQDHFSERPAPLRTWNDVQACAAKYGLIFKSPTLE